MTDPLTREKRGYAPNRKCDWMGLVVESRRDLKSGWMRKPAGTLWLVTYNRSGLSLESEPCACCGLQASISRVDPTDVKVVGRYRSPEEEYGTGWDWKPSGIPKGRDARWGAGHLWGGRWYICWDVEEFAGTKPLQGSRFSRVLEQQQEINITAKTAAQAAADYVAARHSTEYEHVHVSSGYGCDYTPVRVAVKLQDAPDDQEPEFFDVWPTVSFRAVKPDQQGHVGTWLAEDTYRVKLKIPE